MPPFDWESYANSGEQQIRSGALASIVDPTEEEARWLIDALRGHRRWFVGHHFFYAARIPEVFFEPLMDAAIDECEPSGCRTYIGPCSGAFGVRRVLEYLYRVIETESDRRKTGALLAIYMASGPCGCCRDGPPVSDTEASDLKARERALVLATYRSSSDRRVRFAALRRLPVDLDRYPVHLRAQAKEVIEEAARSPDPLFRNFVRDRMNPNRRTFSDTWPPSIAQG